MPLPMHAAFAAQAHEEVVVVTADGARYLSRRAPRQMPALLEADGGDEPLGALPRLCAQLAAEWFGAA